MCHVILWIMKVNDRTLQWHYNIGISLYFIWLFKRSGGWYGHYVGHLNGMNNTKGKLNEIYVFVISKIYKVYIRKHKLFWILQFDSARAKLQIMHLIEILF